MLKIEVNKKTKKLMESQRLFTSLAETTSSAIFIYQNEKFIYVNQATISTSGYNKEELLSKQFWEIVHPDHRELVKNRGLARERGENVPLKYDFKIIRKEGTTRWVEFSAEKIIWQNKAAVIGTAYDITERKNAEEEILKAKNKSEEMNRLKSNFMANMSHELRTPLVGLLGISEFLKDELEGQLKNEAELICLSGQRLLNTITDILNFSKLEAEKTTVNFSVFDLSRLLNNEISLYKRMAAHKGISIIETFSDKIFPIRTDEKLLREIFGNLINNAVKFTDAGNISVMIDKTEDQLLIKIADTGVGIPKDKIDFIFEEFRQISEGISRNFEGTGLGLTIVKKYVQLLGGNVEVHSQFGVGSTFIVSLPSSSFAYISEIPIVGKIETKREGVASDQKLKVLIVEDDHINEMTIKKMLEKNYETCSAYNGGDAIEILKTQEIDFVLMDINLKHGINGIETTKIIRKMEKYERTPIVAMTAYVLSGDRNEFLSSGFTHYIAKPFSKTELLALLENIANMLTKT